MIKSYKKGVFIKAYEIGKQLEDYERKLEAWDCQGHFLFLMNPYGPLFEPFEGITTQEVYSIVKKHYESEILRLKEELNKL